MQKTKKAEQRKSNARNKKRKRFWVTIFIVLIGLLSLIILISIYCFDEKSGRATFVAQTTLSALVLIAILVQAYIYQRQWEVMDRSLVIGTRAYVGLHSIDFDMTTRRIVIYLENIGRVPAQDIVLSLVVEIGLPERLKNAVRADREPYWDNDRKEFIFFFPLFKSYGKYKLFPGNYKIPYMMRLDDESVLTNAEYTFITSGHARLTIKGNINFSDGFNSGKNTDFALRYFLRSKIWIPEYVPAGSNQQREES